MSWIRMRTNLDRVNEVIALVELLDVSRPTVLGCLYVFWAYCDENSRDGEVPLSAAALDNLTTPGFTEAMQLVGWLEGAERNYRVPNFDRHNPQPTKCRDAGHAPKSRRGKNLTEKHHTVKDPKTGKFTGARGAGKPTGAFQVAGEPSGAFQVVREPSGAFPLIPQPSGAFQVVDENSEMPGAVKNTPDSGRVLGTGNQTVPGATSVMFPVKNTGKTTEISGLEPASEKGFTENVPPREEERRPEENREEKKWGGGGAAAPFPSLLDVLKFAEAHAISSDYTRLWYVGMEVRAFTDGQGKPIHHWQPYFLAVAQRWTTDPPKAQSPREPKPPRQSANDQPKVRAPWQVENDLRKVEARLKATQAGWRPDPNHIKVLTTEKKRLQQELIDTLEMAACRG